MTLKQLNTKIANFLADWLSTMAMFYAITFLVISILFFQMPKTPLEWVQYIVQTFFQGVALPVLGFVSKVESNKTNLIIDDIHSKLLAEIKDLKDMHNDLHEILKEEKNGNS